MTNIVYSLDVGIYKLFRTTWSQLSDTWPMPSLLRRSRRRVLIQRNCEYRQCITQELSFQWHRRSPGQRFVWGVEEIVEEIAHFSTAHTWSSTRLFRWEGSRHPHWRTSLLQSLCRALGQTETSSNF